MVFNLQRRAVYLRTVVVYVYYINAYVFSKYIRCTYIRFLSTLRPPLPPSYNTLSKDFFLFMLERFATHTVRVVYGIHTYVFMYVYYTINWNCGSGRVIDDGRRTRAYTIIIVVFITRSGSRTWNLRVLPLSSSDASDKTFKSFVFSKRFTRVVLCYALAYHYYYYYYYRHYHYRRYCYCYYRAASSRV